MNRLQTIPRFSIPYTLGDFFTAAAALAGDRLPDPSGLDGVLARGQKFWTGSGRQALVLILRALGLRSGAGVAVPLYADLAVSSAVAAAGCVPVFVDVDPENLTMDPASLARVRHRISAVVAVHLFGHVARIHEIRSVSAGLPLIEDTVHSPLSFLSDHPTGSFGVACFYSFGSTKCIAAGGGGLVVVADRGLMRGIQDQTRGLVLQPFTGRVWNLLGQAAKSVVFRRAFYGAIGRPLRPWAERRAILEPALDSKSIQPAQAAVALRQAPTFWERVERHRANGHRLLAMLSDVDEVVLPRERPTTRQNFHLFPVLLRDAEERAAVAARMLSAHVDTSHIYYNVVEHAHRLGYQNDCPVSESVARRILTLPNHAKLQERDIDRVATVFREAVNVCRSRRVTRGRIAVPTAPGGILASSSALGQTTLPLHRSVLDRGNPRP